MRNQDKSTIKVVVVEDESPQAIQNLLEVCCYNAHLAVVGIGNYRDDSISIIREKKPDIVFMDLKLGSDSEGGFKVLEALRPFDFKVIFSTAYEEFALRAFHYYAQHYILKPYSLDDIEEALRRCMTEEPSLDVLHTVVNIDHIILKGIQNRYEKIRLQDVIYFEADGKYTNIHVDNTQDRYSKNKFLGKSLGSYCDPEPPNDHFIRCHKSYMINIQHLHSWSHQNDEAFISMSNGDLVRVSRANKAATLGIIKAMFEK